MAISVYAYKLFNMNSKTSLPDSTLFTIEYELCWAGKITKLRNYKLILFND